MRIPIALAFLVTGLVLLIFGLNSADSIQNAFSRMFSGHVTDRTMWLIVGGCVCFVIGLFGCFHNRRT